MKPIISCVLVPCLLVSCSTGPVHVERDFGHSVRQMVEGQISDPEAAANPSRDAAGPLDGVGAAESLTGYRRGARREDDARREIRLSVD